MKFLPAKGGLGRTRRQEAPFGPDGETQLQTEVRGAAHAASPKEGAAHLLPNSRGRYDDSFVGSGGSRC